jgi:hypothetical protein
MAQNHAEKLVPICTMKNGGNPRHAKTLWANGDLLSSAQQQAFADAIIAPKVSNVASVSLVRHGKDGNPIPSLLLIVSEVGKNITLTTLYKALSKTFDNEDDIPMDTSHFPIGRIEQLEDWWPDEAGVDVLAGTYVKPKYGRKRKQTASAGQSVSSARTASDESPPRKRTASGSKKLVRKQQPTKRKRSKIVETSEEEDDGPTAAGDLADRESDFDGGTHREVCTPADCSAASCTITALQFYTTYTECCNLHV